MPQDEKRIAILGTRGIPARYGGFETFAEEFAKRLVKEGLPVTVYCEKSKNAESEQYEGVGLVYLNAPALGSISTIVFDIKCLWHARKKYSIVYMLGYGSGLFCFIPRIYGTKVWINMDGIEWARSKWSALAKAWFKLMETIAVRTPDVVIADAGGIKRHLEKRHSRLTSCRVIPYGVDFPSVSDEKVLDEWGLKKGDYYLIVCRMEPENHVDEIISGYVASQSQKKLVVVGNIAADTKYTNMLFGKYGSCRRVKFIGAVYGKCKLQSLRSFCFAYMHGHSVGGTNPSLLEAMASANAIIAHRNQFNCEVAGDAAIYFDKSSEVPDLMALLERDGDVLHEMKKNAVENIRKKYTWSIIMDAYKSLIDEG